MNATSRELAQGQTGKSAGTPVELPLGFIFGGEDKHMSETTGESEGCSLVSLHTADMANTWFHISYIICENQNSFGKTEPRTGAKPP